MTDKTIIQVVKDGLCTGCGTCVALCPKEAIEVTINEKKGIYVPKLNEEKCNNCETCYKVCPGHSVDFKQLNSEIFGKEPENILIGNYLNCYIGHATDYDIRYNSASGGLVTALLIFALEEGIIDGALVTRMSDKNPLEPEAFIARSREEIISASKSKYCPVPANTAIKEILNEDGKFAVVGLPCHIHGIKKAEMINRKLKQRIVLHLGIFCGRTPTFLATEFLLQKLGTKREDVKKLNYRGKGWPGKVVIELKNGNNVALSHHHPYCWGGIFGSPLFVSTRCTLCADRVCELSDISFGDAWLPELRGDKTGKSILISRNESGERLLRSAISKNIVKLNGVNAETVIRSQQAGLYFKRKNLEARIFAFALFKRKCIPHYNQNFLKPGIKSYIGAIFYCLGIYTSSKLCRLLNKLPFSLFQKYNQYINMFSRW